MISKKTTSKKTAPKKSAATTKSKRIPRKIGKDVETVLFYEAGEAKPTVYIRSRLISSKGEVSTPDLWLVLPYWRGVHYVNRYTTTKQIEAYLAEAANYPDMYTKIKLSKHSPTFDKITFT